MKRLGTVLAALMLWPALALALQPQTSATPKLKSMQGLRFAGIERQTRDYSCGAASLVVLLRGYFNDYSFDEATLLQDILMRLGPEEVKSRVADGFSMLDLKLLAMRLGYTAEGVNLPKQAIYQLQGPVIILLHKDTIKHFVVLKGARAGKAFIADPAAGHYRLPEHELFALWQGEALVLGREGFGLPQDHALSIARSQNIASEQDSVRALRNIRW